MGCQSSKPADTKHNYSQRSREPTTSKAGKKYDLSQHYKRKNYLDAGAVGEVYLEEDSRSKELVAVKYIPRKKVDYHVKREVLNFSLCQHPQIISFREVFLTPTHLAISMEYAEGGNLLEYINKHGPLEERVARDFWQQMLSGIDHCHFLDIVLRDIKPENTLILSNKHNAGKTLKICDFGTSATDQNGALTKTSVGTLVYASPEQLTRAAKLDGRKADVWSAGIILFCMVYAKHPFLSTEDAGRTFYQNCYKAIAECKYSFPAEPVTSPEFKDLIKKILVKEPAERLSIGQIYRHEWFRKDLPSQYFANKKQGQVEADKQKKNQARWQKILDAV